MSIVKKFFILFFLVLVVIVILNIGKEDQKPKTTPTPSPKTHSPAPTKSGTTTKGTGVLGSYFGPRNFPYSVLNHDEAAFKEYFALNSQFGNHTAVIYEWKDKEEKYLREALQRSREKGFKFFLHFDPLTGMTRDAPAPPPSLQGKSFGDPEVREMFKARVLELATLKPDILGIGIEVNLLLFHNNQKEFDYYVTLAEETYKKVKERYSSQTITISFSWDIMKRQKNFDILKKFKNSLDIYSFTTYPNILSAPRPDLLPSDFYSSIRNYLPTERIGISEISWFSGKESSEELQAEFFQKLPKFMEGISPEYVTIFFFFDLPTSFTADEKFNTGGIFKFDGTPKKSWEILTDLKFFR